MEINPNHKLIKKLSKMSKDKNKIGEVENISILLYEQSKILDGEKPSDPIEFSKKLINTIIVQLKIRSEISTILMFILKYNL